eukprot:CAMPEP_0171622934 /NCGR_PEP_ID=MMETSP0990-20121206/17586_1 /TAXON_ID=483369 /ORGANISM="non described non described, Strain CCMP2098" /LENGTH=486 /DNA_ID=CAMNT_0012188921 /DNA_START=82 /DNA_END=1542 /DNA_ORIENTATION=+
MADEKPIIETPAETPAAEAGVVSEPPKVPRPSRDKVNEQQADMTKEQQGLEDKIQALVTKRKSMQSKGDSGPVAAAKASFKELKAKQNGLQEQRKALFAVRDAAKANRDEKMAEMKDLKGQTKYKSLGEVDAKIKQLETAQSTTSMTLAKEKEVLKEIGELKAQRKLVAQVSGVAAALDGGKAVDNSAAIKDVMGQLDEAKKLIEEVKKVLDKDEASKKDDPSKKLTDEINILRDEKKAISDKVQEMWTTFRKDQDAWRENMKAWDAYKKVRDASRKAEYDAANEANKQARAEELAKKTPYEEEMDLCAYLANYLTTTFLGGGAAKAEEAKAAVETVIPEGLGAPMKSKFGETDMYLANNGASSKSAKKKGGKKGPAGTKSGKVVLMPETIESFSLLKMLPPTTTDAVAAAVATLHAKKEAFKTMPRGQIKSIAELNQDIEVASERRGPREDKGAAAADKGAKKGGAAQKKVDVTSTELFPTLGGK